MTAIRGCGAHRNMSRLNGRWAIPQRVSVDRQRYRTFRSLRVRMRIQVKLPGILQGDHCPLPLGPLTH